MRVLARVHEPHERHDRGDARDQRVDPHKWRGLVRARVRVGLEP